MKTALAVFFLIATCAQAEKLTFSIAYKDILALHRIECAVAFNINPLYLLKLDDINDLPSSDILKCHSLCMIRKLNLLNDKNIMMLDRLMVLFSKEDLLRKVPASYKKCQLDSFPIETCMDGYYVQQCLLSNI